MRHTEFPGIYEGAFTNKLRVVEGRGVVEGEMVTVSWFKLGVEEARRFIEIDEYTEHVLEEGCKRSGSWVKLITTEHRNTATDESRRYWSTSLRPYVQGYGCDGTTDLNIHTIANRLAQMHGLSYRSLLSRAYPDDFSDSDDFSWLEDDVVIAETTIPEVIDPDVALSDLEQINNYTLAMEFGIELFRLGVTSTDWEEIRKYLDELAKRMKEESFSLSEVARDSRYNCLRRKADRQSR